MTEQQRREGEQGWEFHTDLPVGEILRRTRVHYEQSLDDVAGFLRIRASQLGALEKGDVTQLPGRVYAIGYVRTYSEYLGLDGDKMVQLFKVQSVGQKEELPELNFPAPSGDSKVPGTLIVISSLLVMMVLGAGWVIMNTGTKGPGVASIPDVPAEMRADVATTDIPPPVPETVAPSTAASLPGAIVPGALAVVTPGETAAEQSTEVADVSAVTAVDAPVSETISAADAPASIVAVPAADARQIVISVKDRSWVEIRDQGNKVLVSRILKPGETIVVPEDNYGLRLDTGNAGGLELTINGQPIPPLGHSGDILRGIILDETDLRNRPPLAPRPVRTTTPARQPDAATTQTSRSAGMGLRN